MPTAKMTLPMPPTVNHYWLHVVIQGKARIAVSKAAKAYRADCMAAIWSKGAPKPMQGRLHLRVYLYFPTNARSDLDNRLKPLLDALTHCRVIEDDSQFDFITVARLPKDKDNPRVEVQIGPLVD